MKRFGLRARITLALVSIVAATCALLTVGAVAWADRQLDSEISAQVMQSVDSDLTQIQQAIENHPSARNWADLTDVWAENADYHNDGFVAPIRSWDQPLDASGITQYRHVGSNQEAAQALACLPTNLDAVSPRPGHGQTTAWDGECAGKPIGYGIIGGAPGGPVAWLVVNSPSMENRLNPVPEIAIALTIASLIAVGIAAAVASRLARSIVRPLSVAGSMAESVAGGDLGLRIPVTGSDEVARMSSAVNTMADRLTGQIGELEATNRSQRRFVADVAHELRTPTAALLASAEALSKAETRDEAAAQVAPQLRRLAGLTEDLLEISAMDAGRALVTLNRIDLVDLAREVITDSAAPASVQLGETDELPLVTDPARLRVILRNLIANAQQHGAPPVTVRLRPAEVGAVIEVTDQGMGVPSELRATVFDRFVRGDQSRHGNSNGLGLAIARENARLLGGELALAPDGRTFVLTLRGPSWELAPTAGQLDEPEPSGPTL